MGHWRLHEGNRRGMPSEYNQNQTPMTELRTRHIMSRMQVNGNHHQKMDNLQGSNEKESKTEYITRTLLSSQKSSAELGAAAIPLHEVANKVHEEMRARNAPQRHLQMKIIENRHHIGRSFVAHAASHRAKNKFVAEHLSTLLKDQSTMGPGVNLRTEPTRDTRGRDNSSKTIRTHAN